MREGWEYQKLGELVKVINGLWVGKKPPFTNVAVVRNANFTKSCTLDMSNIAYIDVEEKQFNTRELQYADIIIEKSGGSEKQPVGRPIFFNIKDRGYSFSNFTATLRVVSSDIVPEYLYKVLLAQYKQGVTKRLQSKTTGLHNLDFKSYLKSVIPIPSCEKQLSIVSELDKINELIRLKKEQLKDYDNLAQSIFYEMFGDPVVNEKGWGIKKLGNFCEIGTGSTPSRKNKEYYEGSISWVKSTEVSNCVIDSTEEHISEIAIAKTNCTIYPKGTILIAMYGQGKTRGQIAILNIEATTNQAVAAILPSELCEKFFLYHCLHLMYDNIRSMARGGNQANLNLAIVRSINIILPPLPLQQLFAQRIELIEKQKAEVQRTISDLETLLASRMQYWFD